MYLGWGRIKGGFDEIGGPVECRENLVQLVLEARGQRDGQTFRIA
jgi:hypothetical protein